MAPHLTPLRRPRSRLQQRQHVRQPLAADERRAGSKTRRGRRQFYELALKVSGAVQAAAGPRLRGRRVHLLVQRPALAVRRHDPLLRALALAHQLGHRLMGEQDAQISLLQRRSSMRARPPSSTSTTAKAATSYDVRGRVAHESMFNTTNGSYRCPSTQQGYSPFSTWTRGLAWAMLGFAEQLELLATVPDDELTPFGGRGGDRRAGCSKAARATCDFYIDHATPADGVPYWDTGAPGLAQLGDWRRPAGRSVQRLTSRSTARPPRSPRRDCCALVTILSSGGARRARGTRRPA